MRRDKRCVGRWWMGGRQDDGRRGPGKILLGTFKSVAELSWHSPLLTAGGLLIVHVRAGWAGYRRLQGTFWKGRGGVRQRPLDHHTIACPLCSVVPTKANLLLHAPAPQFLQAQPYALSHPSPLQHPLRNVQSSPPDVTAAAGWMRATFSCIRTKSGALASESAPSEHPKPTSGHPGLLGRPLLPAMASSDIPMQIAETVQTAHINREPSAAHDINPSTAADTRVPVQLDTRKVEDEDEDDIPTSVLRPRRRFSHLPPLPYVHCLAPPSPFVDGIGPLSARTPCQSKS